MLNKKSKIVRNADLSYQVIGECVLILDSKNSRSFELNETASFLWLRLEEQILVEDLLIIFSEVFDIDLLVNENEIIETLQNFISENLAVEL
jgi:hypothetical protein